MNSGKSRAATYRELKDKEEKSNAKHSVA